MERAKTVEALEWFLKFGYVYTWGVEIDSTVDIEDLRGMVDQIDAHYRGWTD